MDDPSTPRSPSTSPSATKSPSMSLELALDEERRSVINMLEGRSDGASSPKPRRDRNTSPQPQVRSMLDLSSGPVPRHGSIAGNGDGVTAEASPTSSQTIRSMLDTTSQPKPSPSRQSHSALFGLTPSRIQSVDGPRSPPKDSSQPSQGLPKVPEITKKDFDQNYQFDMLPSIANQALPKRVTQGGVRKERSASSAMAAVMSGDLNNYPGLSRGRDSGKHNSTADMATKSKSPSSRTVGRSQSPEESSLRTSSPGLLSSGAYVTDSGKVINMGSAYKRLSGAATAHSGGGPSSLRSTGNGSGLDRLESGESEGTARLAKDQLFVDEGDEAAFESSDEEDDASSEEETWESEASRGRRRSKRSSVSSEGDWDDTGSEGGGESTLGMGKGKEPRQAKSLSAAADEERTAVASKYEVKTLLEPTISITSPSGEKMSAKKSSVHPNTSFDHQDSGFTSAYSSEDEDEDVKDVKRAQKLSINMSGLDTSVPNRCIRTILRGDFAKMQEEVDDDRRRQRTYVVATDLGDEAVYSLEWTIGTILRDSDTLLAIYAIEEGGAKGSDSDSKHHEVGEGARAAQDTMHTMASQTEKTKTRPMVAHPTSRLAASSFVPATESTSHTGSVDSRMMSRAELDRLHAIEDISQTCIRLLRKTRLQVRVVVEVIHTRSPKHMITEAIDSLEPTMAILGSRGRNALKGVLLGSFSNYLVAKSSKPVMVARKRLKKHAKYKASKVRLANNLTNPKRIVTAKID